MSPVNSNASQIPKHPVRPPQSQESGPGASGHGFGQYLGVKWRHLAVNPNVFGIIRDRAIARIQAHEAMVATHAIAHDDVTDDPFESYCDFQSMLELARAEAKTFIIEASLRKNMLLHRLLPVGQSECDPELQAPALYILVGSEDKPEPEAYTCLSASTWAFLTAHLGAACDGRFIVLLGGGENIVARAIDCFFEMGETRSGASVASVGKVIPTEDEPGDTPEIKSLRLWLREAINRGASDLHLEPCENGSRLRLRIDGDLLKIRDHIPHSTHLRAVSWVKNYAQLDISNSRIPQGGSMRLLHGQDKRTQRIIDVRVSTMPTVCGEKLVMRLLDPVTLKSRAARSLAETIWDPSQRDLFRQVLGIRDGLVLVTGPTGSGKTTTLNAGLFELLRLHGVSRNIVTVEDPVEYRVPETNQIQVNEHVGLDFARILRSILRQDPDIVLIGEVRDRESASIAIQAALTGHLILCTLHTNDALGAVDRLKDLGVTPFLIGSTVRLFQAQRLVRLLCKGCRQTLTAEDWQARLAKSRLRRFSSQLENASPQEVHRNGCSKCETSGYLGRRAVMEMVPMGPRLQTAIEKEATYSELIAAASAGHYFRPMVEVALELVRTGETCLSEIEGIYLGLEDPEISAGVAGEPTVAATE